MLCPIKETTKVFVMRAQDKKLLNVHFTFPEAYQENSQLVCLVHMAVEGRLIASKQVVDLKMLSMHQKTNGKLLDSKSTHPLSRLEG